jgi:hypothetical protein
MGLGYLLLSVKSEQDKYLTGNPQFTYFKAVYRKHTNFVLDNQFVNFVGDTGNTFGKKIYIDIPKNGDLLFRMFIKIEFDTTSSDLKNIAPLAYRFIDYVDLYIGGQQIDRNYGSWLHIYHEIFESKNKDLALANMVSNQPITGNSNTVYLPLRFWFNNNVGLALPLIALQYSDVKLELKIANKSDIVTYSKHNTFTLQDSNLKIKNIQLLSEYIHLDKDERRLFSSNSHEYLITQVQNSLNNPINLYKNDSDESFEKIKHRTDLRFNHPIKELFWTFKDTNAVCEKNDGYIKNYDSLGSLEYNYWRNLVPGREQLLGANLVLNGKDMSNELPPVFFRDIQQFQYHNGSRIKYIRNVNTDSNSPASSFRTYDYGSGLYSYSFAIKPEEHQPSGSLNFSKLEQAQLKYRLQRTKEPVDSLIIKVASISNVNININNSPTDIDGIALSDNDNVILKDQTNNYENGIYTYDLGNKHLVRNTSYNTSSEVINTRKNRYKVSSGTINSNKVFMLDFKDTGVLGTDNLNFIDNSTLALKGKTLNIYAVNYNILKITSGMAGLLFTN